MRKFQAALCGLLILCGTAFSQSEKPVKTTGADAIANTSVAGQTAADGTVVYPMFGNLVFNGTTWDRMPGTTLGLTVRGGVTPGTASATSLGGIPMICDSATSGSVTAGQAQMLRCTPTGIPATMIANQNGDTVSSASEGALVFAAGTVATLQTAGKLFSGANYQRMYSATLTNLPTSQTLTARNSVGAQITERGSRWSVIHNPAAGSQATASIAAEASVRHVVDKVCFAAGSIAAPAATSLQVNIRDGATGAGTIIGVFEVAIPAAAGNNQPPFCTPELNLVGTTNTAMTAEFNAGLANLKESVTITGFNVN